MRKSFFQFAKQYISNALEALINLFIFFPYFFSVGKLCATLFSPWKLITVNKTESGFSFSEFASRLSFNLISRFIGFCMRSSLILFYILLQILFVVLLPVIIVGIICSILFAFVFYTFDKPEEEKRINLKTQFIKTHLINEENLPAVETWFEIYYTLYVHKLRWWDLKNLMTTPPLARDWTQGYTPRLDMYTTELTTQAYQHTIKGIVNRVKEIDAIERTLSKKEEANVIIVGEEGVGKHAIVDALAKKIYEGRTNSILAYKRVLKLNLEKILSEASDQKQREIILERLFQEAADAKNIILMIENLDKYVVNEQGRVDLSIPIEKFAKTSLIQFISTTTSFFYQRCIFSNEKINRLFTKIDVAEITPKEAQMILLTINPIFEHRYHVIIPYETILNAIEKSDFYITHIPFPEKAIELLDSACVFVSTKQALSPPHHKSYVAPEVIDTVLSEKTHIPTRLTETMKQKLLSLETALSQQIIRQNEAVSALSAAIRRSFVLIGKRKKPLASFLFLGPTGVGKTETAKVLSLIFFGDIKYLIRFDMSQFQLQEDIPNLIGSMETNNLGLLTKAIRDNPYAVLLLDEIEKANKDLLNIFLTIVDEGYFTDGQGKRVDCKNLIIIATSNAGADIIYQATPGLNIIDYVIKQKIFTPEFLNRFDGVISFKPLTGDSLIILARKIAQTIKSQLYALYKVRVTVTDTFLTQLIQTQYKSEFGARDLQRIIGQTIEDKMAKLILEGKTKPGETVEIA